MCSQGENRCLKNWEPESLTQEVWGGDSRVYVATTSRNRWYLNSTWRGSVLGYLSMEQKRCEFKRIGLGKTNQSDYLLLYWHNTSLIDFYPFQAIVLLSY